MLECADACLLLAEELDLESNVFTASLRGRCVCLQSVVQGDSGKLLRSYTCLTKTSDMSARQYIRAFTDRRSPQVWNYGKELEPCAIPSPVLVSIWTSKLLNQYRLLSLSSGVRCFGALMIWYVARDSRPYPA